VHLGPVGVELGPLAERPDHPVVVLGRRWVVAQLGVLDDHVAHVDAEAGDITVEPEAQDVVERGADIVVPPVEVGLLGDEVVQVVLTARRIEGPRRPSEAADPVVRRRAVRLGVGPHVPVASRRIAP
jgi:hypothetical protein